MSEPPEIDLEPHEYREQRFPPYWPKMVAGIAICVVCMLVIYGYTPDPNQRGGLTIGLIGGASIGGMVAVIFRRWL